MTYIDLVNRFWQMDLEFHFSHLEVHMYFKILDLFNRSGWRKVLSVPNSRFVAELGATEPSVIRARQRLVDSGLLAYSKGTQRKAGKYMLLYYQKEGIKDSTNNNEEPLYVFPTCVGVNHIRRVSGCRERCLPHVRGGEPFPKKTIVVYHKSSPRAWG